MALLTKRASAAKAAKAAKAVPVVTPEPKAQAVEAEVETVEETAPAALVVAATNLETEDDRWL